MGIIKREDVLAWDSGEGGIRCPKCGDSDGHDFPLTERNFSDDDIVICDNCHCRIDVNF